MKIYKIKFQRLKDIMEHLSLGYHTSPELRTFKISDEEVYLQVSNDYSKGVPSEIYFKKTKGGSLKDN